VCDFSAFRIPNSSEVLSPTYSRSALDRLYLEEDKPLYSNLRRPLLTVVEDPVKRHDLLFAACDPARYQEFGLDDHPSCKSNVLEALAEAGLRPDSFPHPVNLFQNVLLKSGGEMEIQEPLTRAGDYIMLQALEDLFVVV
jgi:uncharacterized protein YcgI (DUF1989 family)